MILIRSAAAIRAREADRADLVMVDDNPGDVTLFRAAVAEVGLPVHVHVAEDPAGFFALMQRFRDPPALVVLDLNLPLFKGAFLLGEIREDPVWREVPVVVLTSSQALGDIAECRRLAASEFITKPVLFDGYLAVVQSLARYLDASGATARRRLGHPEAGGGPS